MGLASAPEKNTFTFVSSTPPFARCAMSPEPSRPAALNGYLSLQFG
jgi:hypothetical protein